MSWTNAIVVGGSLLGGMLTNKGAKSAANSQVEATKAASENQLQAAREATAAQKEMYDQNRWDLSPWRNAGGEALGYLMKDLMPGGEFMKSYPQQDFSGRKFEAPADFKAPTFTLSDFMTDPSYQFRQREGQKAIERGAAAKGMLNSGAAIKDLMRFNQDLASTEYGNAYDRYVGDYGRKYGEYSDKYNRAYGNFTDQYNRDYGRYVDDYNRNNTDLSNRFNRLSSVAGLGQTSSSQLAGLGQTAATNIGNIGMNTATNVGNNTMSAGNARAAGSVASANAFNNGLQTIGNYFMTNNLMNRLVPSSTGG